MKETLRVEDWDLVHQALPDSHSEVMFNVHKTTFSSSVLLPFIDSFSCQHEKLQ